MVRSQALKEAQKRYRAKQDKYDNVKKINAKSIKNRYANDETFRENQKSKQREYYQKRKEEKLQQIIDDNYDEIQAEQTQAEQTQTDEV